MGMKPMQSPMRSERLLPLLSALMFQPKNSQYFFNKESHIFILHSAHKLGTWPCMSKLLRENSTDFQSCSSPIHYKWTLGLQDRSQTLHVASASCLQNPSICQGGWEPSSRTTRLRHRDHSLGSAEHRPSLS